MASAAAIGDITTDPAELAKFATLGREWWDATGPMAPLHKLNPVRVAYIRDRACHHFGRDPKRAARRCRGWRVLDVGCGGGLLAEPLARLGGAVTAIDPVAANIDAARWHAEEAGVEVDYQAIGIEALAAGGATFDLVIASEVVEHVADVAEFLAAMAAVTRPGGLVVLSTLSRTAASFVKAVSAPNTCWAGCRAAPTTGAGSSPRPSSAACCARTGCARSMPAASDYDGSRDSFELTRDLSVNYLLAAARD